MISEQHEARLPELTLLLSPPVCSLYTYNMNGKHTKQSSLGIHKPSSYALKTAPYSPDCFVTLSHVLSLPKAQTTGLTGALGIIEIHTYLC